MRNLLLLITLVSSSALAKKPVPAQAPSVAATARPTRVERAEMFEGQVIAAQIAQIMAEDAKLKVRVADYQARVKAQYGVDLLAGDQINYETGAITWHVEKKAVLTGGNAGSDRVEVGK